MIRLLAALLIGCLAVAGQSTDPGFVRLFDGTLNGWKLIDGKGPGYVAQNGVLVCPVDGGGNLFTEKEYTNFVLRFEFRLTPGGNNGIAIRAPLEGRTSYVGMEIQILDDGHEMYRGKIKAAQYHGSIYDVVPAKRGFKKATGEWNAEEITADGRRIKVVLNGHTIVDANLDDVKDPEVLQRHPGLQRTSGHIGFLGHDSRVDFRNVRIRELPR
jgi:3-keto-disaccharide hydrolase